MIAKKLTTKIAAHNGSPIPLLEEEKEYVEKHQINLGDKTIQLVAKSDQFKDAAIERLNKETDEQISKEKVDFLQTSLTHFETNKEEYVFVESSSFDVIGVDGIAIEFDEVFEVYTAMFGLSLQKKYGPEIKAFLNDHFESAKMNYSVMFSGEDGLWEVNLPLNFLKGFDTTSSLEETLHFLYTFVFKLVESTEK